MEVAAGGKGGCGEPQKVNLRILIKCKQSENKEEPCCVPCCNPCGAQKTDEASSPSQTTKTLPCGCVVSCGPPCCCGGGAPAGGDAPKAKTKKCKRTKKPSKTGKEIGSQTVASSIRRVSVDREKVDLRDRSVQTLSKSEASMANTDRCPKNETSTSPTRPPPVVEEVEQEPPKICCKKVGKASQTQLPKKECVKKRKCPCPCVEKAAQTQPENPPPSKGCESVKTLFSLDSEVGLAKKCEAPPPDPPKEETKALKKKCKIKRKNQEEIEASEEAPAVCDLPKDVDKALKKKCKIKRKNQEEIEPTVEAAPAEKIEKPKPDKQCQAEKPKNETVKDEPKKDENVKDEPAKVEQCGANAEQGSAKDKQRSGKDGSGPVSKKAGKDAKGDDECKDNGPGNDGPPAGKSGKGPNKSDKTSNNAPEQKQASPEEDCDTGGGPTQDKITSAKPQAKNDSPKTPATNQNPPPKSGPAIENIYPTVKAVPKPETKEVDVPKQPEKPRTKPSAKDAKRPVIGSKSKVRNKGGAGPCESQVKEKSKGVSTQSCADKSKDYSKPSCQSPDVTQGSIFKIINTADKEYANIQRNVSEQARKGSKFGAAQSPQSACTDSYIEEVNESARESENESMCNDDVGAYGEDDECDCECDCDDCLEATRPERCERNLGFLSWGWDAWERFVTIFEGDPYCNQCVPCEECEEEASGIGQAYSTGGGCGGGLLLREEEGFRRETYIMLIAVPLVLIGLLASFKSSSPSRPPC